MGVTLGFCFWDLIALLVLFVTAAGFTIRTVRLKRQEKELERELSSIYADQTSGKSR